MSWPVAALHRMARTKLTAGRIRDFACPPGKAQAFLWDSEAPGLAVRATAGAKADRIATAEAKREEARRIEAPALEAWNAYIEAPRPKWGGGSYQDHLKLSKEGGEVITRGRKTTKDGRTQPGALRPLLALPLSKIDAPTVRAFLNWCADRSEYQGQIHADACAGRVCAGMAEAWHGWPVEPGRACRERGLHHRPPRALSAVEAPQLKEWRSACEVAGLLTGMGVRARRPCFITRELLA